MGHPIRDSASSNCAVDRVNAVVVARDVEDAKLVRKPWGDERWLVPESPSFAFKRIRLAAGKRTSLQLHCKKEEANLVLSGAGAFLWRIEGETTLRQVALSPGAVFYVPPGTVHRIVAETDLTLVEVSTPEVDDVIRLADDSGRPDGKIGAEHAPLDDASEVE